MLDSTKAKLQPQTNLILLSGGSGKRLWPLSNDVRSKQFLKVLRDEQGNPVSMVQRVYGQIKKTGFTGNIVIATLESQVAAIQAQLDDGYHLAIEPERRDTMPAIMLSSMFVASELEGTQRDDTIIVMPIDFYVEQDYFDSIEKLTAAVQADIAVITLLGINPTYPSEKYGYIVPKSPNDTSDFKMVSSFKEKPDSETANQLISQGAFWNGGVFAFKLGYLLDIITKYTSSMSYQELSTNYGKLPKTSFDYGVAEKTTSVAVIPYSGMWKDLGTWNTLTEEMADAASGIAIIDESDTNVHVVNELIVPIVVTGLSDVIVAATPDGILVSSKEASVDIKDLIERIEVRRPMYEQRYWGEYHVLDWQLYDDGHRSLTKKICIREGAQLSYQRHALRSEIWTIVDGEGELVLEGIVTKVSSGDIINIAVGKMHAVRATKGALEFFEVQLGSELIEEDIERYGYFWNE